MTTMRMYGKEAGQVPRRAMTVMRKGPPDGTEEDGEGTQGVRQRQIMDTAILILGVLVETNWIWSMEWRGRISTIAASPPRRLDLATVQMTGKNKVCERVRGESKAGDIGGTVMTTKSRYGSAKGHRPDSRTLETTQGIKMSGIAAEIAIMVCHRCMLDFAATHSLLGYGPPRPPRAPSPDFRSPRDSRDGLETRHR